jgi:Protein of unknown function (DUF4238)
MLRYQTAVGGGLRRMTARRHHYVPQFYLKGFTVERKKKRQVTVFDGKDRKVFTTAIDNVALERDFNRVEIEGVEPDVFEKAMAGFEGEISAAIDRIIATRSIGADRVALINLICALALRNPRLRETIRDFHERVAKQVLDLMLATPERWAAQTKKQREEGALKALPELSYDEMKKFAREANFKLEVPTERHIRLEVETFNKMLPILLERKWLLLRAPKDSGGFITSDHPVVLAWSDPKMRGGFYGPGFGLTGTDVYFPISTGLAVIGAFELEELTMAIGENAVAGLNGAQVDYAERQVYARDRNFTYALQPNEAPRKASKLIGDKRFRKPKLREG